MMFWTFNQLDDEKYKAYIRSFIVRQKEMVQPNYEGLYYWSAAMNSVNTSLEALFEMRRDTTRELKEIHRVIKTYVIPILKRYEKKADESTLLTDAAVLALEVFALPKYSLPAQEPFPVGELPVTKPTYLKKIMPEVDAHVQKVLALTAEVSNLITSSEDEYFVEQVTVSYLPEIYVKSADLVKANEKVLAEAQVNFINQLLLIEQKLEIVILTAHARTLRDVKAQTEFLETKFGVEA